MKMCQRRQLEPWAIYVYRETESMYGKKCWCHSSAFVAKCGPNNFLSTNHFAQLYSMWLCRTAYFRRIRVIREFWWTYIRRKKSLAFRFIVKCTWKHVAQLETKEKKKPKIGQQRNFYSTKKYAGVKLKKLKRSVLDHNLCVCVLGLTASHSTTMINFGQMKTEHSPLAPKTSQSLRFPF